MNWSTERRKSHLGIERCYNVAPELYAIKSELEQQLCRVTDNLFSQENRILLFDLINFYFEGIKRSSQKAKFGRSKEKRSDCKLLVLALCINTDGFIRYSSIRKVQRKDENGDYYLQVNSPQKLHTEESMNGAFKERFGSIPKSV